MEVYDPALIGKPIALVGWNSVYRYGTREVIKFPKLAHVFGADVRSSMERDILIGKRFFGEYMLETRLAASPDGTKRVLIQKYVRGRVLRKADLATARVANQFKEILARHESLVSAGYAAVDLMSGVGFLFGTLRNIFLLEDESLRIIDLMLIDMLHEQLYRLAKRRQEKIVEHLFGQ